MRFKRPQVRYADTPQPATPYQAAAGVGRAHRLGPRAGQELAIDGLRLLVLALLMAGGWCGARPNPSSRPMSSKSISPAVRTVGEAATPYRPTDAQTAHHIARFVTLVRSLSIDPIVVRQNWLDAYDYTTDRGAAVLNDYARVNDPFARIGKESVTVQITSVVRASMRRSTCAGWSAATSMARRPGWSDGRRWCPSCSRPRAPKNACAATRWASTSMACRGAVNWIRLKE